MWAPAVIRLPLLPRCLCVTASRDPPGKFSNRSATPSSPRTTRPAHAAANHGLRVLLRHPTLHLVYKYGIPRPRPRVPLFFAAPTLRQHMRRRNPHGQLAAAGETHHRGLSALSVGLRRTVHILGCRQGSRLHFLTVGESTSAHLALA
jgi:hypothetical protein